MKNKTNLILIALLSASMVIAPTWAAQDHNEHDHDSHKEESHEKDAHEDEHGGRNEHDRHDDHDEKGTVILTTEQQQAADIVVKKITPELIQADVSAPAEVKFNTYKTASISPRISAQVLGCYVVLGEVVRIGQPIVSLSSVEMAEAQGALLLAGREWKRVKKLGRQVVSESRYTEAKVNWELARARVKAYGMSDSQINDLLESEDFSRANGRFELVATHGGTVLKENYILGQQVEPGHELIRITNEDSMWVVANVPPSVANVIDLGNQASIEFDGEILPAKVIQKYHSLDESTRTTGIRLEVNNKDEKLHPGMFVNARIETSSRSKELTLPEEAVLRSPDGDWIVMIQNDHGEFESQEVEMHRVSNGRAITSGIAAGTPVVVKGSFFVWSESVKAGFDAHNH